MTIDYKGASLFYTVKGSGPTVVFLHGFLEDHTMWDFIRPQLIKQYQFISIDLLGHGNSQCIGYIHSIEEMAKAVNHILKNLKINEVTIVGHSMGGYVGCAFAKAYPKKTKALCLLNSTTLPDDNERKKLRSRANEMAKNQYEQFVRMSFTNLFEKTVKDTFKKEIQKQLVTALKTPVQGYIAANSGMAARANYLQLWKLGKFKKGIILGIKDWIIDYDWHQKNLSQYCDFFKSIDSGHMSHITATNETQKSIISFLKGTVNKEVNK